MRRETYTKDTLRNMIWQMIEDMVKHNDKLRFKITEGMIKEHN